MASQWDKFDLEDEFSECTLFFLKKMENLGKLD